MTSVGQTVNYNVLQTYILYCHAIKLAVCEFEPNRRTFEYVFEYEYEYVANFMDIGVMMYHIALLRYSCS